MREFDSPQLMAIRAFIAHRHDEIVSSICRLVEIESPSGDVQGSRAAVALLEDLARTIPSVSSIERVDSPGIGEHLRIRAFCDGANSDDSTLMLGHTDTVHPRGTLSAQHGVRAEADRLYGPGIFDMKASCVIALEVLRCLAALALAPQRPLTLLLTCDEEVGSATGRSLVEHEAHRAAQVLVLEPPAPGGCVKTARKGVGIWTVSARGVASHAGLNPEAGASAILELARQTERLHSLNDPASGTSFNVGLFRGGTHGNVVAAHAEMEVDVRFGAIEEARRVEHLMNTLQPVDGRVLLAIKGGINRAPLERTAGVVRLFHHARDIAARLGFELGERAVGGASDGNFAAALDVPVLDGLGVDGDGAHAAHEHILVTDIVPRAALLAGLVASL
ncbi:MAG TPA: M20 family metallopeptidase [Blastocatellia bacterium]|nr:M20 family metallopeptidase [Blastocatellia bacterium]